MKYLLYKIFGEMRLNQSSKKECKIYNHLGRAFLFILSMSDYRLEIIRVNLIHLKVM